ncbi:hypothetical protein ZWY2020_047289 [Hordeum vulgare]|nr:hypothetical protein ZWY2020_047289 [Hordeum vulgare]
MVVVPVAVAVGIAFAVLQWVLVSKVKVTTKSRVEGGEASAASGKYGASEYLIEEEEGLNDHNVVLKCAEIQTAISEAYFSWESGVDQLVEIIKVLGTPTREEIKCMNPNYTEFKFPQIKAHP